MCVCVSSVETFDYRDLETAGTSVILTAVLSILKHNSRCAMVATGSAIYKVSSTLREINHQTCIYKKVKC